MLDMLLASEARYNDQIALMKKDGAIKEADKVLSYREMVELVKRGNFDIKLNPMANIGAELFTMPRMAKLIAARNWTRILAPAGSHFVTCDHPVSLWWSDPAKRRSFYPPGFGLTGTEALFPLSKSLALLGTFEGKERDVNGSKELVAAFNGATIANLASQVYAESPDFHYVMQPGDDIREGAHLLKDVDFLAARKEIKKKEK